MSDVLFNLTPTEVRILRMLADGNRYPRMGEMLKITDRGVAMAVARINQKMNTYSPAHAVATALRRKIIE